MTGEGYEWKLELFTLSTFALIKFSFLFGELAFRGIIHVIQKISIKYKIAS